MIMYILVSLFSQSNENRVTLELSQKLIQRELLSSGMRDLALYLAAIGFHFSTFASSPVVTVTSMSSHADMTEMKLKCSDFRGLATVLFYFDLHYI